MSKKGGTTPGLQKDVPWRVSSSKPIPKIHHSPILRVSQNPFSDYALSVMKHPNPIGTGLATEALVEAAGPDCIVPGQITPIRLVGLKVFFFFFLFIDFNVWPIEFDLKFIEPVGRELKLLGKIPSLQPIDIFIKTSGSYYLAW
ncbi:hypothetical protein SADUNF_Sadunf06G0099700 [Salix dunnii]|uniref:Uncharacterized protein n=1 Tax=Salix dunnii TaxID=1413687 RepID=A0A835K3Y0_9ROSI|nr:hypothetical protein SADUNF_Sadunf06G0099700 [Salix dunnii]